MPTEKRSVRVRDMRRSFFILLLAVAVAGLVWALSRRPWFRRDAEQVRDVAVEVRELGRSLVEHGWLVSLDSVPVIIGAMGEITEIVGSGEVVKEGDVVIRIDDANARERLENVEFETQSLEQNLAASKTNYGYTELTETNRNQARRNDLAYATLQYGEARRGLKPEDRRLLEIELAIAELDAEDAEEELARQQRLLDKEFVSELMVERYERHAVTARAAVEEIRARIRLEEKGLPAERLLELEKEVERLQGVVERGERAKERALEAVLGYRRVTEAHLDRGRHSKARTQEEIDGAAVLAPASGIMAVRLHYGGMGRSYTEYKPGEMRYKNEVLADIVNPGRMKVELMVHEADAGQIGEGMPARIRLPAFPGRTFAGRVKEIGEVGRDRADVAPSGYESGRSGVTMFNATVSIEGEGAEFHPGMSATVEIEVEAPSPQLVVPRAALVASEDGPTVLLKAGGQYRATPVQGRPLGDDFFVVEKGLREKDTVGIPVREEEG